jgi:hypothetical protein
MEQPSRLPGDHPLFRRDSPYTTGIAAPNVLKKMKYSFPLPERFKTRFKEPIWIEGYDIIGLFHMQKHQLARFDIWPLERGNRFDKGFRTKKYRLDEVYAVATFTPNCSIQETPDQAVERYFKKFGKCGKDRWGQLNRLCEWEDCSTMHCGGEPGEPGFKILCEHGEGDSTRSLHGRVMTHRNRIEKMGILGELF